LTSPEECEVLRPLKPHYYYYLICLMLVLCSRGLAQVAGPTPTANTLPESGQRVTLLESLQSTLAKEPQLQIQQQQVEISRALKQQATGQFDLALAGSFSQARTNSPLTLSERALVLAEGFVPTSNIAQNLSIFSVGATKLYRNGVQFSPLYQTTRTTDNLTTSQGTNSSLIALKVTIPLLRGRGREAVAAQETAAGYEVSAALLDLNQTISDLFAATASSYWEAVGATKQLEVARSSEERGRTFVDNVQTLIQADRIAKAEINQASANLATRTAERIAAEQTLIRAQQQLALAMGLDIDQMSRANFSFEDFPEPESQRLLILNEEAITKYVQQALSRRADYLAAQRRIGESRVLLAAAQNAVKPSFNLNLEAGGSGLSEGTGPAQFFNSPYHSIQGLDAMAGLTYNFPLRNNFAAGEVRQAQATLNQAQLRATDLSRLISSSVVIALSAVRNAAAQLDKARESVKSFEAALQGEREKFSLGFNSLVDVLTVEDHLTAAMVSQVSAELSYALALTQLRFATGTIVEPEKAVQSVDRDLFFSLP
jgi:outer membrane protein